MYIRLKREKILEFLSKAAKKAGSQNKAADEIGINKKDMWNFRIKNRSIPKKKLNLILEYIGEELCKEDVIEELPDNWKQMLGGRNCVKKKKEDGTLNEQLKESRGKLKQTLSDWHKKMKKKSLQRYYKIQYNRFKKVADYKFNTENGERVRNSLERDVANILIRLGKVYQYEPLVRAKKSYFFPDFLVEDKTVIECTMWRGYDKAIKLREKINLLKSRFKVHVVIPEKLIKYYEPIKENLIIGLANFEKVAEHF